MSITEPSTTTAAAPEPALDEARIDAFVTRFVDDLGAVMHAATVILGDRLGLYRDLAEHGPTTAEEVTARTGVPLRHTSEWLSAQAAAGYVDLTDDARFWLSPEHALTLVEGEGPVYIPGAFLLAGSTFKDVAAIATALAEGRGYGWHQHDEDLFTGTEAFFRPGYAANLVDSWLPALDGVVEALTAGATVADVGCGLGASTILLADAFPASRFVGSDYHAHSIELARERAVDAGLKEPRVRFETATAATFSGEGYDLVTTFDCFHDLGDPLGAARHIRDVLAPDGTWLLVEPMAGETLADNLNPVGKVFYSGSSLICTPASLDQEVGLAIGPQASEATLAAIVSEAGFTRFRRATETPFNRIYEVRR